MKLKKILIVFGTRPEAIKMAPLIKIFKSNPNRFETKVCVTGQHRQMLDQVLSLFEIIPDYSLDIMKIGQDLYDITNQILIGMKEVLKDNKPDVVFVHGDTTTSMTVALAAFYQQISIAHIEAGLRTYNIYSPWPEEMNRQITSRIASHHFAPTNLSKLNLLKENINENNITVTGNTVIDSLFLVVDMIKKDQNISSKIINDLLTMGYDSNRINNERKLVLITGHRRENFGQGFLNICNAIKFLSEKYKNFDFVYPMHLNPNVREPINEIFGFGAKFENLFFIEPLEYLSFVYLMDKSFLILTDSGGVQEEAPSLGKPVLVMRDTTERPEAVEAGTVIIVGTDFEKIVDQVSKLIENPDLYANMSQTLNPYGDGLACERIVNDEFFIN